MAEKIDHTKEWTKISKRYLEMASVKSISDPYYYRHRCIEGLLAGTTYNYAGSSI